MGSSTLQRYGCDLVVWVTLTGAAAGGVYGLLKFPYDLKEDPGVLLFVPT